MPLDPAARRFLDAAGTVPQPQDMTIEEFRRAVEGLNGGGEPQPVARAEDVAIPGGDGRPLTVRLYVPAAGPPREGELRPVVVWMHGGSFVRGTLDTFDAARRAFANLSGCVVVAVDQRLAPESRFPAPIEDAYAAVAWAAGNAAGFGGDPGRIGVAGESSGGNLAAAVTLLARARGGPPLLFQVLFTPLLDATMSMPSISTYGRGYVLTREQLAWCYDQYAPDVERDDELLSPLRAPDVSGLPAAVVVTVEYDPVRDEGEAYARRLAAAGVPVRRARLEGMLHHFPGPDAMPVTARLTRELLTSGSGSGSASGSADAAEGARVVERTGP